MIYLALTLNRLFLAIVKSWKQEHFRGTLILGLLVLASGTLFYSTVEKWSVVDALYFSVATAATVGYGDLAPTTTSGKLFAILYMFVSIGVFVALFGQIARTLVVDIESHGKELKPHGDQGS